MVKLLFKILICIPLLVFSQKKSPKEIPQSILIDSTNNEIIFLTSNSLHRLDISSLKILNSRKIKNLNPTDFKTILKNDNLLFLERQGGDILVLNSNDSLKKIDNSNISKFFIGSYNFIKNDTLFKHGGYGYWSQSNFLIYFENLTKEWQLYPISEKSEIPRKTNHHMGLVTNDDYYYFGGWSQKENGTRESDYSNKEVWSFNFNRKQWSLLGNYVAYNLSPNHLSFTKGNNLFVLDNTKQLFKIDFVNNLLTKFKRAPILFGFSKIKPIFYNDFVYFVDSFQGNVAKVSITELTKEIEEITQFHHKDHTLFTILIVLSFFILFVIIFYFLKYKEKNRTLELLENGIKFKNKFIELEPLSISIIKMVKLKDIELSKVYDLVKKDQLSKIQNERIKNQFIDQINLKLAVLTGKKEDFLIVSKSSFDKRYKIISINRSVFGKII
tara:strand:- start:4967 stop:6292 length:1326 start_codon:yes stop_codon:yes gene_type:complete